MFLHRYAVGNKVVGNLLNKALLKVVPNQRTVSVFGGTNQLNQLFSCVRPCQSSLYLEIQPLYQIVVCNVLLWDEVLCSVCKNQVIYYRSNNANHHAHNDCRILCI